MYTTYTCTEILRNINEFNVVYQDFISYDRHIFLRTANYSITTIFNFTGSSLTMYESFLTFITR